MADKKTVEITSANFEELVLNSDKPVLVDFWAKWCGPCIAMGPDIDKLAEEMEGTAVVGKLDIDQNRDLAMKYGVMSIPTVIVFNGGEIHQKNVGRVNKAKLADMLPV
jgi:thioredoxin 1